MRDRFAAAAGTAVRRSMNSIHTHTLQFERRRNRRLIGNFFSVSTADASAARNVSESSAINRIGTLIANGGTPQPQRIRPSLLRLPLPMRLPLLPRRQPNRWLATSTRKRARKRKVLAPSHAEKITTKDRLRLSARPSRDLAKNHSNSNQSSSGANDWFDANRMMVKSPEELVEKLNSGLNVARGIVRETYVSLRNPEAASAAAVASKTGQRTAPPPTQAPGRNVDRKGIVMDANWWFWNLLFAASPAALIALYCEFIVKPEMKERYEKREKEATESGGRDANGDDSARKLSPMRQRQEERQRELRQQRQEKDDATSTNRSSSSSSSSSLSSSSMPWSSDTDSGNNVLETLSSFVQSLLSASPEPPVRLPEPTNERDTDQKQPGKTRTDRGESKSQAIPRDERVRDEQRLQLRQQQRELSELQSRIQMLKDRIDRQEHDSELSCNETQRDAGGNPGSSGVPGTNEASAGDENQKSLRTSPERSAQAVATAGSTAGKTWWGSLRTWWQRGDQSHPSATVVASNGDGQTNPEEEASGETTTTATAATTATKAAAHVPSVPRES